MKWLVSYFSSVEYLPLCRTGITSVQYYYYQQWYWNTAGSNKFKKRWKQRRHSNCRIKYWSQHSESQTHTHTHTPYPLLMGVKHSVWLWVSEEAAGRQTASTSKRGAFKLSSTAPPCCWSRSTAPHRTSACVLFNCLQFYMIASAL